MSIIDRYEAWLDWEELLIAAGATEAQQDAMFRRVMGL